MLDMRRREFITLLGGAVATWPLAARAQGERMRRIGVLLGSTAPDRPDVAGFLQALQQLGWSEGHNLRIDYRWGRGNAADTRKYAQELVALAPDVLLVSGASSLTPLLQATRTLPIVFTSVADPVGAGFVESMSRPGGNATGFIQFEYSLSGKWLELLKQVAPSVTRAAVLRDPTQTAGAATNNIACICKPGPAGSIPLPSATNSFSITPLKGTDWALTRPARLTGGRVTIRGVVPFAQAYAAVSPAYRLPRGARVAARGTVRRGGITLGLLNSKRSICYTGRHPPGKFHKLLRFLPRAPTGFSSPTISRPGRSATTSR